ncbi:transmembrane emp24 domain-containing protein 10-like [Watersipora subatra]|uniref:transmembrane emp24 domain-containing protein 10-like n=1 Tax=Watersipora subatra TaxID=2589382 RepID=UPI00355AF457
MYGLSIKELTVLLLIGCQLTFSTALRFTIPANGKRCLKEEIHKHALVKGDYELSQIHGHHTTVKITDARDHIFYNNDKNELKGVFAFSVEEYDLFEICFINKLEPGGDGGQRAVTLNIKHGAEMKDYEAIAKAEKLKPLEKELRKLEDLSESIVSDFAYMRSREEEMRSTNESTHSRVLYFSVFSLACLIGLATWQVLYLRKYFKSKKLID